MEKYQTSQPSLLRLLMKVNEVLNLRLCSPPQGPGEDVFGQTEGWLPQHLINHPQIGVKGLPPLLCNWPNRFCVLVEVGFF